MIDTSPPTTLGSFLLNVTQYNSNTGELVSTATNTTAPVSLNGTSVDCSGDGGGTFQRKYINYPGTIIILDLFIIHYLIDKPSNVVNNISITPITDDTLLINWTTSEPCIDHYTFTINSNNTHNESRNTDNTNITIDTLIGTNYSFIIIPIDTIGREGPLSSLIQYIWNGKNYIYTHTHTHTLIVFLIVPAQVVNISWYQISTDSITIWWNNTQVY